MGNDLVYFINSQGKKVVLSSPGNKNYWELVGRTGFTAPEVDIFTEKFASGNVKYFGKAIKPRNCSMRMICRGKSTTERDDIFFGMLDVLLDDGGTGEGRLYVKNSNGLMVYLNCVYSGGMRIKEQYEKFHIFDINFYAADPRFYYDLIYDEINPDGYTKYNDYLIENDTDKTIWPEFHFSAKPVYSLEGNPCFRLKYAIWLEILNHPTYTYNDGTSTIVVEPEYYNISIYTDPERRGVYGDRVYNYKRDVNVPIPEIIPDNDIDVIFPAFNIPPGTSAHLEYERMEWDYGTPGGTIVLPKYKTFMGA